MEAVLISAMVSAGISFRETAITPTSLVTSVPLIRASTASAPSLPSSTLNRTVRLVAPAITWLFVTIRSSVSFCPMIIPVPVEVCSRCWGILYHPNPQKLCTSRTLTFVIATREGIHFSTMDVTSALPEFISPEPSPVWGTTLSICGIAWLLSWFRAVISSPNICLPA